MLEAAEPVQLQQELMEALALNIRQMLFGIWIDYNIPFLYLAFFYVGIISWRKILNSSDKISQAGMFSVLVNTYLNYNTLFVQDI